MKTIFTLIGAIILFWVSAIFVTIQAQTLAICTGEYALCAASSTTLTGKTMMLNGKTFKEGVAVCPILNGAAVANMDLMVALAPHQKEKSGRSLVCRQSQVIPKRQHGRLHLRYFAALR